MRNSVKFAILGATLALTVVIVALMRWEIPAPTEHVERTLPDEDFPR